MTEDKIKILGITGPSGCGKDYAALYFAKKNPVKYNYVKLKTTRPPREEEKTYNFMDTSEFLKEVLDGKMLNAQQYNEWWYGLSATSLVKDKINVVPMSWKMIQQMKEEQDINNIDLKLIYVCSDEKERLKQLIERDTDYEEMCRRFIADKYEYTHNEDIIDKVDYLAKNDYTIFFQKILNEAETQLYGD